MSSRESAATLRPLGLPRPVEVRLDGDGLPAAVARGRGEWRQVEQVADAWRVAEEWWRDAPQERTYVRLVLEDGRVLTLFHDGVNGGWFEQRYASDAGGSTRWSQRTRT